ncbi:MAG: signal recognition particle receptor subunit alpha [Myxococcota bacterium]
MLETLTRGFRNARDRFQGITQLTEENITEALRDVRISLLEADVDLGIVREFLDRVSERCLGESVRLKTGRRGRQLRVSPGDHFTKACYEELVALMGSEEPIAPAPGRTRVLMMVGLQGTGKTTTCAKLALHLKKGGEKPLLVGADVRRPAAREQLRVLAGQIGVEAFNREGDDAAEICALAVEHARENGLDTVILDTGGRIQIDDELMAELARIAERTSPEFTTLVCDSMMGREAVNVARGFAERIELDGLILTKLDGDARGGAALAIRSATGIPIRCVTMGEGHDRLETFRPEGIASRILGMGDVVGLIHDFEEVVDAEEAEKEAERLLRGNFSLDSFLTQLRTLQKMGPLKELMEKIPGMSDMLPEGAAIEGGQLVKIEAMILSMTPQERLRPEILDGSRQERVARGSGTQKTDLVDMLKRFATMRELMAQIGQAGPGILGKVPGLGKMFGGGMPGPPGGFDPAQLGPLGLGQAPNRRTARAQKADDRRQKRRQLRKHKRRGKKRK